MTENREIKCAQKHTLRRDFRKEYLKVVFSIPKYTLGKTYDKDVKWNRPYSIFPISEGGIYRVSDGAIKRVCSLFFVRCFFKMIFNMLKYTKRVLLYVFILFFVLKVVICITAVIRK